MNGTLLELFRHKTWATLRLIEICQGLADEHLDATIPGTYGTVRETLLHLVDAEEGYYRIVTRERLRPPLPEHGPVELSELADRIRGLGPHWENLAQGPDISDRECTSTDGWKMPASIPMAQAIHHADDHRTQILSILGARGIELPDLAIWGYAEELHRMELIASGA